MQATDRAIAKLAAGRRGVVSRAQAEALGASARMIDTRLRTGSWERAHRCVYRLAEYPETWESDLMAACLLGPAACASHRSAAALRGLAGSRTVSQIELVVPRGHARPRPGITLYRAAGSLHPRGYLGHPGIPATTTARTLIDLASVLPADMLEEAVDDALARNLVSPARLKWQLEKDAPRRRRGISMWSPACRPSRLRDPRSADRHRGRWVPLACRARALGARPGSAQRHRGDREANDPPHFAGSRGTSSPGRRAGAGRGSGPPMSSVDYVRNASQAIKTIPPTITTVNPVQKMYRAPSDKGASRLAYGFSPSRRWPVYADPSFPMGSLCGGGIWRLFPITRPRGSRRLRTRTVPRAGTRRRARSTA